MVTLTLSAEQVIQLVKQLPPQDKQAVMDALSEERRAWWDAMLVQGEQRLRHLAAERGMDWERMGEQAREDFVDDLMHEGHDAA